jgi:hypothetical protein
VIDTGCGVFGKKVHPGDGVRVSTTLSRSGASDGGGNGVESGGDGVGGGGGYGVAMGSGVCTPVQALVLMPGVWL